MKTTGRVVFAGLLLVFVLCYASTCHFVKSVNTLSPSSILSAVGDELRTKTIKNLKKLKEQKNIEGKIAAKILAMLGESSETKKTLGIKNNSISELLAMVESGFLSLKDKVNQSERPQALENLKKWLTDEQYAAAKESILFMIQESRYDELFDSFARNLKFGTGGRRGLVGIGPNRVNEWTMAESVKGHIDWLFSEYGEEAVKKRGVTMVGDVRKYPGVQEVPGWGKFPKGNPLEDISSIDYIHIASEVYAAYGIPTYIIEGPRTTPQLSIMTKALGKILGKSSPIAGVVFTSSHNQPWYNGIKFYIDTGSQLVPPFDNNLIAASNRALKKGKVERMQFDAAEQKGFITVLKGETLKRVDNECQQIALDSYGYLTAKKRNAVIAFDSMHGTGGTWALPIFLKAGYRVRVNPNWLRQDGDFPSAPLQVANPEVDQSFNNVIAMAKGTIADAVELKSPDHIKKEDEVIKYIDNYMDTGIRVAVVKVIQKVADAAMTMDPDADRMGVAFADTDGKWHGFNENDETNLMLIWSKCKLEARKLGKRTLQGEEVYGTSTIVTTPLTGKLMNYLGVKTKFKMPNLTDKERKNPVFNGVYVPPNGEEVDLEDFFVGFKNPSNFADLINALAQMGKIPTDSRVIVRVEEGEGGAEETTAANDKDSAVLLTIADQLSLEKEAGGSPVEMLMKIYKSVGVSAVRMVPMIFADAKGTERIAAIMNGARNNPPTQMGDFKVKEVRDYQAEEWGGAKRPDDQGNWAKTDMMMKNVVRLDLALAENAPEALQNVDDAKVVKRPSGTEPKNKDCCHLVFKALGEKATTEQIDEQRRAINAAGDLLRRATLKYSYEQSGTLAQVAKEQHERLLDLHDFMTTDAKLGYLKMENALWEKATNVANETLSQTEYVKWFEDSLAKIGIKKKDAPILLEKALLSFLKTQLLQADSKKAVSVILQTVFPKDAAQALYTNLTGDTISFSDVNDVIVEAPQEITLQQIKQLSAIQNAKNVNELIDGLAKVVTNEAFLSTSEFQIFLSEKLSDLGVLSDSFSLDKDKIISAQVKKSV